MMRFRQSSIMALLCAACIATCGSVTAFDQNILQRRFAFEARGVGRPKKLSVQKGFHRLPIRCNLPRSRGKNRDCNA
jgi:molybdopterin/thiamine biosynthesis adenylyltransferase